MGINSTSCCFFFLRIGENNSQGGWIQLEMFVSFVKQCHMAGDSVSSLWTAAPRTIARPLEHTRYHQGGACRA